MSRGDRSVSEFIRIAVLAAIAAPSGNPDRVQELEQRIQRLEEQLFAPRRSSRS
jgi:hypothetical protein